MVAIAGFPELHTPPAAPSVNAKVVPVQTVESPDTTGGAGNTVTLAIIKQPVVSV